MTMSAPGVRPTPPRRVVSEVVRWLCGGYLTLSGWTIILGVIDYRTRTVSLAAVIHPTGDYAVDLVRIQSHYRDAVGKNPDQTQCGTGAFPPAPDDS